MTRLRLAYAALLLTFSRGVFGQELLSNGSFDTSVDGWMEDPSGSFNGPMVWTGSQGQPPGALTFPGGDQEAITEECYVVEQGTYLYSADAFMATTNDFLVCSLNYYMYSTMDCSGPHASFTNVGNMVVVPNVEMPNQWERLEFNLPLGPQGLGGSLIAFRPALAKSDDQGGDDTCLFDNASFRLVAQPLQIPTLTPAALVVLAALLAVAALIVLRRRPTVAASEDPKRTRRLNLSGGEAASQPYTSPPWPEG